MPCRCRPLARPGVARPAREPAPAAFPAVVPNPPTPSTPSAPVPIPEPVPQTEEDRNDRA